MSWPGLCESDNIKRMITLTVIPLSGAYCNSNPQNSLSCKLERKDAGLKCEMEKTKNGFVGRHGLVVFTLDWRPERS